MLVIHVYTVLTDYHVDVYVPAATPAVGRPMEESRLLVRSTRSFSEKPPEVALAETVADCLEQMALEGVDVQAVVEV